MREGPPRFVAKTKPAPGNCRVIRATRRFHRRGVDGPKICAPPTCRVAFRPNSTWDNSRLAH